jgi:hypothetical protein
MLFNRGTSPPQSSPQSAADPEVVTDGAATTSRSETSALAVRAEAEVVVAAELLYQETEDEVATAALPPVRDYVCLGDFLPSELFEGGLESLRMYWWFDEDRADRAGRYLEALPKAKQASRFLMGALYELYGQDRAERAAIATGKGAPVRHESTTSSRSGAIVTYSDPYWSNGGAPSAVADAVASFLLTAPDVDQMRLAHYKTWVGGRENEELRLEAVFGPCWVVEVARWDRRY